ncbi:MAG: aspartate aminotransferase family protein [Bacteroidetes bacterium]|nr:aspartate aminotransferase family protein [Bacteroidota bacterium]
MKLFDVYPLIDIEPVKGEGCYVTDKNGEKYLDLYGGHAVISVGHSHPYYVKKLSDQLQLLGFYSNSVIISLQDELAEKLGRISGYDDFSLFLSNSGAEANENALKLASFHTKKYKVIAFKGAFHGRSSGAVAVTDNPAISAPLNFRDHVTFLNFGDTESLEAELKKHETCAVIIEGIQGVKGIVEPSGKFLQDVSSLCKKHETILILDEIQSGYGRTGKFFAHQFAGIKPDIITVAKGMGNGFPIAGTLISEVFEAKHGLLGTTFGGNHLACTAGIAVLDIIQEDQLIDNAVIVGEYLVNKLKGIPEIKTIRGKGLMLGLEFSFPIAKLRGMLIREEKVFTGSSSDKNVLRLLPPLTMGTYEADMFVNRLLCSLRKITESTVVNA